MACRRAAARVCSATRLGCCPQSAPFVACVALKYRASVGSDRLAVDPSLFVRYNRFLTIILAFFKYVIGEILKMIMSILKSQRNNMNLTIIILVIMILN